MTIAHLPADDQEVLERALRGESGDSQKRLAKTGIDWLLLLLRKNRDYGDTVFRSPCLKPDLDPGDGILVRASDKISRIANLIQQKDKTPLINESLEDSIADLGAYCLIYLCREKPQPAIPKPSAPPPPAMPQAATPRSPASLHSF